MCFIPIAANPYIHLQGDRKIRGANHVCPCLSYKCLDCFVCDFEYEFIMHLHDQARGDA